MKITPRIRFIAYMVLMAVVCIVGAYCAAKIAKGVEAMMMADRAYAPSDYPTRR